MRMVALGGDKRYAYMVARAREDGLDAFGYGLSHHGLNTPELCDGEMRHADCVIAHGLPADDVLARLSPGAMLCLFMSVNVPEAIRDRYHVIDLSRDEQLARENAWLTAEGAVSAAMQRAEFVLRGASCLIVGFGRIGYALNEILVGMGARPTVAARRGEQRRQAVQRGAEAVDMAEMEAILHAMRVVFSTPPEMVIAETQFARMREDALVVDLSSSPYGVDLEAAGRHKISAWREPGLPGRYCPESAGAALLRAVQAAIKCGGRGA